MGPNPMAIVVAANAVGVDVSRRNGVEEEVKAHRHYRAAKVDGIVYKLGDDVYVLARKGKPHFVGRITELFEGTDCVHYFNCRWFFRSEDTVISTAKLVDDHSHDPKRVFLSDETDDDPLDCIVSKLKIVQIDPKLDLEAKAKLAARSDLYYDMSYTVAYSTFGNITKDINGISGISSDSELEADTSVATATLLDLYSGCGGMPTGLCLGAALAGLKLETRWAVDFNSHACKSLKSNHPRTEKADDFLSLLKEWAILCDQYVHGNNAETPPAMADEEEEGELEKDEYVVQKLTDICYGGVGRKRCIYFKVQWKGYGPEEDTWEPIENLRTPRNTPRESPHPLPAPQATPAAAATHQAIMTGRGGPTPGGPPAFPASPGASPRVVVAPRGPSPAPPASPRAFLPDPASPAPPASPRVFLPDPAPAPRLLLPGECSYAASDGPPRAPSPTPMGDRRWELRDPRVRDPSPVPEEPGRIQGRRVKSIIVDSSGAEVTISGPDPGWTEVARRGKRLTPAESSVPRSSSRYAPVRPPRRPLCC
ncbi:DNA (cytosine-5)-methyltransferase 1 [Hordeum vulgare]|nr:DNA (cytosine-5)-methyltransferase 1 [Hordeum vulgare]